ncbi:Peptidase C13, legumain [Trema orientale]|uniref:Peptidase C13, legumain n=1 Tax=Trema orientale TaxID=63057 RepID=A0A2P5EQ37_TREOI|nr:Peptidase C13, legumain [Trema orientale]
MNWDKYFLVLAIIVSLKSVSLESEAIFVVDDNDHEDSGHADPNSNHKNGTRWAVLVAGSNYYDNYRHQADVCHAYQVLKKGGLKDENIIVFMYDDIAFNTYNPRPGVIINKPHGPNVYEGVPKDYTGNNVTAYNLYAVILGNRSALTGGSGKVVNSGPNDHIFIYYADHGGPGVLGMPASEDYVYAKDLVHVLKKKHEANAYQRMVIYIEACESGSIFDGLLPKNISIYATTASNGSESSYATYCPGDHDYGSPLDEYDTCLGDMYSVSWMEDCEKTNLRKETLGHQYEVVRRRTAHGNVQGTSHVMQYGNMHQRNDLLFSYMGSNPANDNFISISDNYVVHHDHDHDQSHFSSSVFSTALIRQRDGNILHFWHKFHKAPTSSPEKLEAKKQLDEEISRRSHIDYCIYKIGKLLFGSQENSSKVLNYVRPHGQPLVDDWDCFKIHVKTYEKHCGRLSIYGMKYTRAIANMCNSGVTTDQLVAASVPTCSIASIN